MMPTTAHALPAEPITTLGAYERLGGLSGLATALVEAPDEVIDVVDRAGVRGRGGAGFPTGRKWRTIAASATSADRTFVVVNAAEGEPGTFKDRALLRRNPYLVLEGALIAAHAVGAGSVVVATKAGYRAELAALRRAVAELGDRGIAPATEIAIVEGPDHYLFGEETALLEVVEGEDPLPRNVPPYLYGLFTTAPQLGWSAGVDASPGGPGEASDNPTLVNNVETFAHAALALRHGADWYRSLGTPASPGPTIVTITGDVQRAVVAEIELGHPLVDVLTELSGGPRSGRAVKAVLSGVSNPVLTADRLDTPVAYETLAAAGSGLGSAGFVVYDDSRNMVDVAYQVSRFLHVESCGQCTPCKAGTDGITRALEALVLGSGGTNEVVATIDRSLRTVADGHRCYLPIQEQLVVRSLLDRFPDDLRTRLDGGRGDLAVPLPKLLDIVDGEALVDARAAYKRPDWTYADQPVQFHPR